MGPTILVDLFVPLSFFALIFGIFYIRNRENMALIERGINPRVKEPTNNSQSTLKYGLLLLGCGLGLLAATLIETYLPAQKLVDAEEHPALYFSLIAIGGGLGLVVAHLLEQRSPSKHNQE
jgi:hypothetical protein